MRDYTKLQIWRKGIEIAKEIYKITKFLPSEEKYGLKSQICRASISISSNIAEGSSRSSELDFKRFLEIALGSVYELESQIYLIKELKLVKEDKLSVITALLKDEQKMLNTLIKKLKSNTK